MTADIESGVVRAQGFEFVEMVAAVDRCGQRFVSLLRSLDASDAPTPTDLPGWDVAQTAVHMLNVLRRGLGDTRRADSVQGLRELNDLSIAEISERDPCVLADLMEADLRTYVAVLSRNPQRIGPKVVDLHSGVRTDVTTALSYQLVDFMVHAWDIARPTGRPWSVEPTDAWLGVRACTSAMRPWVVDQVLNGPRIEMRVAAPCEPVAMLMEVGEGEFAVHAVAPDETCIQVDPVDLLLAVAHRTDSDDDRLVKFAAVFGAI